MSTFNYNDYQNLVAKATTGASTPKVGFFKLKDDGDEAIIRINCASTDDLQFAAVHTISANGKWLKVSCLNPFGDFNKTCPLCAQANAGNGAISKASKKVYIQMLAAYKDKATNTFSQALPVIWERPAGFAREVANLLKDYGNLKDIVLKVTRNGLAGDMKTTYSIGFIPVYNKPELVPADFSSFERFDISRHSYWEKTVDEINTFLNTGSFPETIKANTQAAPETPVAYTSQIPATPVQQAPTYTTTASTYAAPVTPTPVTPAYTAPVQPTPAPVQPAAQATEGERPARPFGGFSF